MKICVRQSAERIEEQLKNEFVPALARFLSKDGVRCGGRMKLELDRIQDSGENMYGDFVNIYVSEETYEEELVFIKKRKLINLSDAKVD